MRDAQGTRLVLLGVPRVHTDDGEHVLAGSQPRLFLTRVALAHGRPVTSEQLADVLWTEGLGPHWEGALRGVASKVRAFLGHLGTAVTLDNSGRTYRLAVDEQVSVDLWQAQLELAMADVETSPISAGEAALRAIELLEAPLLPGHDADWLEGPRADLARMRNRALRIASEGERFRGRFDDAAMLATRVVTDDPLDEYAHRLVMLAHECAGRRGAALRAYETCRQILVEELGARPSAETEALYMALLVDDSNLHRSDVSRPLATDSTRAFVGRTADLEQLSTAWAEVVGGERRVVFIAGEAGAGKTRLAVEAMRRAGPSQVLYGRCSVQQFTPYEPFAEALATYTAPLDDDELRALLGSFANEIAAIVPAIAARLGLDVSSVVDGDNRPRLFEGVRSMFERIARTPIALVIDDAHAADPSTVMMFRSLIRTLASTRLLVICTFRNDVELRAHISAVVGELTRTDGCRVMRIGGLDLDDVQAMLSNARMTQAGEIARSLHIRTGGNPFYVTQVMRTIDEQGERFRPAEIPETVIEVVRSRLATLNPDARSVLEFAATIGTSVPRELLDGALARVGQREESVDELIDRHLLVESSSGELSFAHGIVRDAAYGLLPGTRRRRLHLVISGVIEDLGDDRTDLASALAAHLDAAQGPAQGDAYARACIRAAEFAMAAFDYDVALRFYERAKGPAQRLGLDASRMCAIQLGLGSCLRRVGDFAGARRELELALDIARTHSLGALFAESMLELVANGGRGVAPTMADAQRIALLEEAIDRLGEQDIGLAISLSAELALALMVTNDPPRMRAIATRAGDLADQATAAGCLDVAARGIVATRLLLNRPNQARQRLNHSTSFLHASPAVLSAEQRVRLHMWRLADCMEIGDRFGSDHELEQLRNDADHLAQPYWLWVADAWAACHRFVTGDADAAIADGRAAIDRLAGIDHPEAAMASALQVAAFQLQLGQGPDLVDLLRSAVAMYPQLPSVASGLAVALAQTGRADAVSEARALFQPIVADSCAAVPDDGLWSMTIGTLCETARLLRDVQAAKQLIPILIPHHDRFMVASLFGAGLCWGSFSAHLGGLYAVIGDTPQSNDWYDRALAAAERFGSATALEMIRRARAELE